MDLLTHDPGSYHVSLDAVWEFEKTILSDSRVHERSSRYNPLSLLPNLFWRNLYRLRIGGNHRSIASASSQPDLESHRDMFAVLMGPNVRKTMPSFLRSGRKSIYLFDAWPATHEKIRSFVTSCQIEHLFISSQQGTATVSSMLPHTTCHWVPEGINPDDYRFEAPAKKDIDVLQLGRRYDRYHHLIAESLEQRHKLYLYEKLPGQIIFPTRDNYLDGLARAKISVCVPLTLTNSTLAGGIETMTARYLQSMLAKCLIIGHSPGETLDLFGYNPVVEIDFSDPAAQLLSILGHMEDYIPLIERNYRTVIEGHTWRHRWEKIAGLLFR